MRWKKQLKKPPNWPRNNKYCRICRKENYYIGIPYVKKLDARLHMLSKDREEIKNQTSKDKIYNMWDDKRTGWD